MTANKFIIGFFVHICMVFLIICCTSSCKKGTTDISLQFSETAARLDTLYKLPGKRQMLLARYSYEVGGKAFFIDRKTRNALPHGFPIPIRYKISHPEKYHIIYNQPVVFNVGQDEYFVTIHAHRTSINKKLD